MKTQYDFEQERKRNAEIREEQRETPDDSDQKDLSMAEKKSPIVKQVEAMFDTVFKDPEVPEEVKASIPYHLATIRLLAEIEKDSRTGPAHEINEMKEIVNQEVILPRYYKIKAMFPEKFDVDIIDMILNELRIKADELLDKAKCLRAEGNKDQAKACEKLAKIYQDKKKKQIQNLISGNK